ncbi:MAG: hypothetical protein ACRER2_03605 [Methylococcales bacterium]
MFGVIDRFKERIQADERSGLGFSPLQSIYNLRLKGVADPFNADLLWGVSRALGDGMCAEDSHGKLEKDLRLATALSRYNAYDYGMDQQSGEKIRQKRTFFDVAIWIARSCWEAAREEGGGHID